MKVSLSYQIDFDRIPEEITHFLTRVQDDLCVTHHAVLDLKYSAGSGVEFMSAIADLRDSMNDINEQLGVIVSITSEYEKARLQLRMDGTVLGDDTDQASDLPENFQSYVGPADLADPFVPGPDSRLVEKEESDNE